MGISFTGRFNLVGRFGMAVNAIAAATDAFFNRVSLLLSGDGTNGANNNTFIDSSTNNFAITRTGTPTQGTFSPFSQTGWSGYFNGSDNNYLSTNNVLLGAGDFTVEFWLYKNENKAYQTFIGNFASLGASQWQIFSDATGQYINMWWDGMHYINTVPVNPGSWHHIAWVRSGSTGTLYINGVSAATETNTNNFDGGTSLRIGHVPENNAGRNLNGYMSNVRIVLGTAVYTSNFTPSTTPLTAIANTALLTLQSNRFVDNSTNNFAITAIGTPKVQAMSPFNPTTAWSPTTNGGSIYFNGSEYLSAPSSSNFAFGSGDFTIEAWIYPTLIADGRIIFATDGSNSGGFVVAYGSAGTPALYFSGTTLYGPANSIKLNQWHHIAVVRASGQVKIYTNGVGGTQYAFSSANSSSMPWVGMNPNALNESMFGYISDLRVVKGTAVYTSNFVPSTTPLTAITNTQLLLSGTNAGFIDSASKNDIVTAGNTQISTAQSKFGGGSMSFDGTGDYLKFPLNPDSLTFGSSDFTVEAWVYTTTATGTRVILAGQSDLASTTGSAFVCYLSPTATSDLYIGATGYGIASPNPAINQWSHVAWVRHNNTWKSYLNGTLVGSAGVPAAAVNVGSTTYPASVGAFSNGASPFTGYIDDLRVTKGYARYTADFTPPTAAFPVQ